jgi:hypothetical protein
MRLLATTSANTLDRVATVRLARASIWALLAATVLQVIVQVPYALGLLSVPDVDVAEELCTDPPCGPEGLPPPELSPMVVPFLLLAVASLLGVALLLAALIRLARTPRRDVWSGCLLAVAPVLVLIGGELVPHAVSPCWFGEISGVCERTPEHGVDWDGRIHLLARGLVGWLPTTILAAWVLARWRPELLPQALGQRTRGVLGG